MNAPPKKKTEPVLPGQGSTYSDWTDRMLEDARKLLRRVQQPSASEFWMFERMIAQIEDEICRRTS
jgi:hypothetical protein